MIIVKEGNILYSDADVICQQVNCQSKMASGLAKQIRAMYPEVYTEYKKFCNKYTPNSLLGMTHFVECHDGKIIANLFGQLNYGTDKIQTDYSALRNCLEYVRDRTKQHEEAVAIPYNLGCGLAGGDWNIVYKMIDEVFCDYAVTIYKFLG